MSCASLLAPLALSNMVHISYFGYGVVAKQRLISTFLCKDDVEAFVRAVCSSTIWHARSIPPIVMGKRKSGGID